MRTASLGLASRGIIPGRIDQCNREGINKAATLIADGDCIHSKYSVLQNDSLTNSGVSVPKT